MPCSKLLDESGDLKKYRVRNNFNARRISRLLYGFSLDEFKVGLVQAVTRNWFSSPEVLFYFVVYVHSSLFVNFLLYSCQL